MSESSRSIAIKEAQFDEFERLLLGLISQQSSIPPSSILQISDSQMDFIKSFVLTTAGNALRKESWHWLRIYRDTLADQSDCDTKSLLPLSSRIGLVSAAHTKAMLSIIDQKLEFAGECIKMAGKGKSKGRLSGGHQLFTQLPNELPSKVPLGVSLLVGRCLGFGRCPASDSFCFAGKSYNMRRLCESIYLETVAPPCQPVQEMKTNESLVVDDHVGEFGDVDDDHPESTELDDVSTELESNAKGGSLPITLLRLCALKAWYDKMVIENKPYSAEAMTGTWLKDAVEAFNSSVTIWRENPSASQCKVLNVDIIMPSIYKLATGWIKNMNAKMRNKLDRIPESPPVGDWNEAVLKSSSRTELELFYNYHITKAKLKLVGMKRSFQLGNSASAKKRRAIEASIALDADSVFTPNKEQCPDSNSSSKSGGYQSKAEVAIEKLGDLLEESRKQDEEMMRRFIEESNRNTEKSFALWSERSANVEFKTVAMKIQTESY